MSKARTQKEIEQLSREVEALVSDHQELVDEVTTEVVRLEKQGRKQHSIRMAANIRNS
jgi:t-SNARE complex subunit (syntaxin)